MAKIKKISELEQLSSLSSSSNVIIEENGKAKRIAASKLVVSGSGEGGASVQSDWNQNDSSQPDFVKNRTHWEENSYEEILPEATLAMQETYGMMMGQVTLDHTKIVVGGIYRMVWDGVAYEAPSFEVLGSEGADLTIGNPGIVSAGEDNGIPFAGAFIRLDGVVQDTLIIVATDAETSHTLSISVKNNVIHKLNPKFLPEGGFGWEENNQTVIEWDGSTEGREHVSNTDPDGGGTTDLYKLSDLTPTKEELLGGTIRITYEGETREITLTEAAIETSIDGVLLVGLFLMVLTKTTIEGNGLTINVPSTGCYAMQNSQINGRFISLTYGPYETHKLDEKFIPDIIARVSEIPEVNYPVTSVNGMTGDVVIETGATEQTQADWSQNDDTQPDYVKNRTHWEENTGATIEWDGNTEGRDHFTIGLSGNMFKVSDLVPESSKMLGATMHFIMDEEPMDVIVTEDMILSGDGCYMATDMVMVVQRTDIAFGDYSAVAPSAGIYMNCPEDLSYTASITYGSTTVHKLNPKFLPEGGFGWEENNQTVIEWDGSTEGRDIVDIAGGIVKISDTIPDPSEVIGGTLRVSSNGEEMSLVASEASLLSYDGLYSVFGIIWVAQRTDVVYEGESVVFPSTGVYVAKGDVENVSEVSLIFTYGSTTVHQLDEKYIPETIARVSDISAGGVSSWNDLTDKPFYEENGDVVITWDGNTDGRGQLSFNGTPQTIYKVSGLTPSAEELIGGSFTECTGRTSTIFSYSFTSGNGYLMLGSHVYVCYDTTFVDGLTTYTCPSPGVYMKKDDTDFYISNITYSGTVIHKLDEKFIPDTVVRMSDINAPKTEFVLSSPNGTNFRITIDDSGKLIVSNMNGDVIEQSSGNLPDSEEAEF